MLSQDNVLGWTDSFWRIISGIFMTIVGYFLPIRDILGFLVFLFIADTAIGYWTARKLRKEKFSGKIIWNTTMPRMVIAIILVLSSYMWDDIYKIELISTHKTIGWFISGVLIANIAQNGYKLTRWTIFLKLFDFFKKKSDITDS